MRQRVLLVTLLALAAIPASAEPIPPCQPAIPINLHIHFLGATSACTEASPVCMSGELLTFTLTNDRPCLPYVYTWSFDGGAPITGRVVSQSFDYGIHAVTLTATVQSAPTISTMATLTVPRQVSGSAPNVPTLGSTMLLVLAATLGALALTRMR